MCAGEETLLTAVGVGDVHDERLLIAAGVHDPVPAGAGDAGDAHADADAVGAARAHLPREDNTNRVRVKTKAPWIWQDNAVSGGTVRRASPAMIHTYFEYTPPSTPPRPPTECS